MGVTHVTAVIRNPAEPDKFWEGLFLVNTGAVDSLVPRPHLEAIGLNPKGRRVYGLADGSEVKMDITTGDIEIYGRDRRIDDCIRRSGCRTATRCDSLGIRGY